MTRPPILIAVTLAVPGGAQTFVLAFAKWLMARQIPVVVATGDTGTWLEEQCLAAAIPFRRISFLQREINPFRDALAVRSFIKLLKELKPSALHLNSSKAGVVGSLAGRIAGVSPIVYCIAGWAALETASFWKRALYLWPERLSAGWKDTIVCLHEGDARYARTNKIEPRHALEVIPNGIDIERLRSNLFSRSEARGILGLSPDKKIVGTIAHFFPAKDLPRYIEACAQIVKQRPDVQICLVGDGMERSQIEAAIRTYGLEGSVILCGAREQASRYLNAFDAFALPSKKEGMPYVLLEAATAGLPIVATDVGANRWMLPEARIVPPGQPEAFAAAVLEALDAPEPPSYDASLACFSEDACFEAHLKILTHPGLG